MEQIFLENLILVQPHNKCSKVKELAGSLLRPQVSGTKGYEKPVLCYFPRTLWFPNCLFSQVFRSKILYSLLYAVLTCVLHAPTLPLLELSAESPNPKLCVTVCNISLQGVDIGPAISLWGRLKFVGCVCLFIRYINTK